MTDYTSWYVGMKVACVDDDFTPPSGETIPVLGRIYTLRSIAIGRGDPSQVYVRLVEIVNKKRKYVVVGEEECCFNAVAFRPVEKRKTSIEVFTKLLKTKSEKELVQ